MYTCLYYFLLSLYRTLKSQRTDQPTDLTLTATVWTSYDRRTITDDWRGTWPDEARLCRTINVSVGDWAAKRLDVVVNRCSQPWCVVWRHRFHGNATQHSPAIMAPLSSVSWEWICACAAQWEIDAISLTNVRGFLLRNADVKRFYARFRSLRLFLFDANTQIYQHVSSRHRHDRTSGVTSSRIEPSGI